MDASNLKPACVSTAGGAGRRLSQTLPFVSVIVPVRNGERTVRDCLVSRAARTAVRCRLRRVSWSEVYDPYFTFLLQLAARLGFLWGSLARGDR
jgi:hypothetical protein